MKTLLACAITALGVGCATVPETGDDAPPAVEEIGEFMRPGEPEGLSGISMTPTGTYFSVDDRGGRLYELKLDFGDGEPTNRCEVIRKVELAGRVDLEGCAFDPLTGWVWVSDEADTSITAYDPRTGEYRASVKIPEIFKKETRPNRSFEALTISPDGRRMYTANEDTLKCDGKPSSRKRGARVRIQEFVRGDAGDEWRASRQFFYRTDPIAGGPYHGHEISGVVGMAADADGSLFVLEREFSTKTLFPTFRAKLCRIPLHGDSPRKLPLWSRDTLFSNYEGICFGPCFADGSRTLVLISDGGGKASETFLVLKLR